MKSMTVALLKAQFSEVIQSLRRGEEFTIEFGKNHEKLGVIIPYAKFKPTKRKIGMLEGKAGFKFVGNFKMTDEEFFAA